MKKVAVITGVAGGIGYYLAEGFAKKGYQVIGVDIQEVQFQEEGICFKKVDLAKVDEIFGLFQEMKAVYGGIHVLINNGAISSFHKSIKEISVEEFGQVIDVNLRGSFACCKAFVEANEGEDYGRIINIASTRWHQNEADWEAYGASKGGLVSLTNSLCVSLAETPITVNAISPGWIQVRNYEELGEQDHKQHPSGRVGKPEDIVRACLFLAEEGNEFINGANLVIDGGMTKRMIYEG